MEIDKELKQKALDEIDRNMGHILKELQDHKEEMQKKGRNPEYIWIVLLLEMAFFEVRYNTTGNRFDKMKFKIGTGDVVQVFDHAGYASEYETVIVDIDVPAKYTERGVSMKLPKEE